MNHITNQKDYSAKELEDVSVFSYTCLGRVTGIYAGKCDGGHWDKCVEYNQKKLKDQGEYDKYLSRDWQSSEDRIW